MNSIQATFPTLTSTFDLGTGTWSANDSNPYVQTATTLPTGFAFVWDETIDLTPFAVQDKTFFPDRLGTQQPGLHLCGPAAANWNGEAGLEIMDIITSVPISIGSLKDALIARTFPGMPDYPLDNQFIMMGKYCAYSADANLSYPGLMNPVKEANFGAGLPTAADKLFCYRIVLPSSGAAPPQNGATLEIPGTRYTIAGRAEEESELAYIYRLRQSYEQKQG
jgi:hypothetical protein